MQHTVSSAGRKKWYCLHVSVGEMMRTQTCVSTNCWHDNLGIGRVRRDARRSPGMLMAWFNSCGARRKQSRWVYTSLLDDHPTVPGANQTLPAASGRPPRCNDFHDWFIARWSPRRRFTTHPDRRSLLPPRHRPHPSPPKKESPRRMENHLKIKGHDER